MPKSRENCVYSASWKNLTLSVGIGVCDVSLFFLHLLIFSALEVPPLPRPYRNSSLNVRGSLMSEYESHVRDPTMVTITNTTTNASINVVYCIRITYMIRFFCSIRNEHVQRYGDALAIGCASRIAAPQVPNH